LRLFCAIIWAISIGLSVANSLIGEYKIMLPFPLSLFTLGSIYDFCPISALVLYAVMGAKLIWMKCKCAAGGLPLTMTKPFPLGKLGAKVKSSTS
jgi:hypothetical protein